MASITDYMFDTSFLSEMLDYLHEQHQIEAIVVDSDEKEVIGTKKYPFEPTGKSRLFPFAFQKPIGGILCSAASDDRITTAKPHIELCRKAVDNILLREQEMHEAGNELLHLSQQLSFLHRLAQKTVGITKIAPFCQTILDAVTDALKADQGILILSPGAGEEPLLVTCCMETDRTASFLASHDVQASATDKAIIFSLNDGTSALVAPFLSHERTMGYMAFFRDPSKRFFTAYEKKFASIINNSISPSLEAIQLYDSLQALYLNTVKALAAAIDAKDPYTHGHSFRVAKFSLAISEQLRLDDASKSDLEIAAYMHDLGKIGVRGEVLGKPGKLTDEEFAEIKMHPVITEKILEPIHLPKHIVDGAIMHHERLDGSGYPFGAKGDAIPFFAQIIAVADVFDALTSSRPYRSAMPVEKALRIMRSEVPGHFTPDILRALLEALCDHRPDSNIHDICSSLECTDANNIKTFITEIIRDLDSIIPSEKYTPAGIMAAAL